MRKISLFMLMAVGLLISGNAGAQGTNNVRLTYGGFQQDYNSLQTAFDNLPQNSTPATVTLLDDVQTDYEAYAVTINKYHNVTLDLNGYTIFGQTEQAKNSAIITNYGTLSIVDNSESGEGRITNLNTTPEKWKENGQPFPYVTHNTITNYGSIYVKGGTLENHSSGGACYVIDNSVLHSSVRLEVSGGKIINSKNFAIRQIANSTSNDNVVEIKGGLVSGTRAVWIQLQGSDNTQSPKASFIMSGGTLKSIDCKWTNFGTVGDDGAAGYYLALYVTSDGNKIDGVNISISGGDLYGGVLCGGGAGKRTNTNENVSITGGNFLQDEDLIADGCVNDNCLWTCGFASYAHAQQNTINDAPACISGGIFKGHNGIPTNNLGAYDDTYAWSHYVMDGYCIEQYGDAADDLWQIVPCNCATVNESGDWKEIVKKDGDGQVSDETTNVIIGSGATIEVNDGDVATANKITGTGEAQIIVKNGAILDVGNGGLVSENDELITVLVETGGTLIIGNGGVDKIGAATPIKIQAGEEKGSGTLIFSPNAKHEDTEKYAEVDLYTYCKKVGEGKYTWQQFAIPVTGLDNSKVVKTPNKTSYVFEWDYATYGWSQLNNWAQLDEPFAGYDITNISENGGVVYTFKGDLIGNQNIQLTLPHKDYCVMGNSYTAPIDITALFDQINQEMSANTIEKTVYKYNAKAGYYVYTNELEQVLAKAGVMPASFTDIKPMEGFLLNLQNGNTAGVMLNYANAVYTPAMTPNTPATAPRMANTDMVLAKINVKSAHAMDQMTLVESDEFSAEIENGKDAFKYLNEGANLYAFDGTNKLAMVATDNLEGTMLAFQAAEDAEYTLTFDRALNTEYVLVDMMNGNEIAMTEGNTYTFFATPNTLNPSRFMIVATAQAPTDMVNTKANKAAKGVYTITGQYLGNGEMWNELPQGIYMVNGVKVIK